MKRTQFMVQEEDKEKREKFYDYITKKYNFENWYPYTKDRFIDSNFPFVVDFKEKKFWVSESITCCAAAATRGVIFTINEFKKFEKEM